MPQTLEVEAPALMDDAAPSNRRSWRAVYFEGATSISRGLLPGLVCGALVGGVGGRMSMFLLRVLSDDSLHGMKTDDDFTIGSFTGETAFLVLLATFLGALGGLIYLAVREWLAPRWRSVLFGLLGATVGGTLVIRPDGVDFTVLSPLWLAVALFVALPAVYAVSLSLLTERLVRSDSFQQSRWRWVAVLPLASLLLAGPFGIVALLLLGFIVGINRSGEVTLLWRSAPVTWLGRAGIAAAIAGGGIFLARDVVAVL